MSDDSWRHSLPGPSRMSSGRPTGSGDGDDSENDSDGRERESYGSENEDDNRESNDNGNNNVEYNTDSSNDDDAPLFGRSGFPHLEPADLVIIQEQLDDMWIGKEEGKGESRKGFVTANIAGIVQTFLSLFS